MKIRAFAPAFLLGLIIGASPAGADAPGAFRKQDIERGRYLSIAGDCAACHTAPNSEGAGDMAGGYPIISPLGTIYSTNITPSRTHGVGAYSELEFARAIREGIRKDGTRLYPAMPYTSYARLTDEDTRALYAYFMSAVKPVEKAAPTTRLPFPFNVRTSMRAWNALFLKGTPIADDNRHDHQWNRGRYLAETLAHCSSCHSPRGLLMEERGGAALSGGSLGTWYAPNITSDKVSGIGGWTRQEISQYLSTGRVAGKAQAAGDMAEAVAHSFSQMNRADIDAISAYISSVPPVRNPAEQRPAYAYGTPVSIEATLRGSEAAMEGARLYSANCAACHGRTGSGSPDGVIPSLYHNSTVGASRPDNLISVILRGVDRTVGGDHVLMPGFGDTSYVQPLTDSQIASLATFVRKAFGPGDTVNDEQVALARAPGSQSILLLITRAGLALGVTALLILVLRPSRRRKPGLA